MLITILNYIGCLYHTYEYSKGMLFVWPVGNSDTVYDLNFSKANCVIWESAPRMNLFQLFIVVDAKVHDR